VRPRKAGRLRAERPIPRLANSGAIIPIYIAMTDRLSLADARADAKIERSAAERIAIEILNAIHDNVATRVDLQRVEESLRGESQGVEH